MTTADSRSKGAGKAFALALASVLGCAAPASQRLPRAPKGAVALPLTPRASLPDAPATPSTAAPGPPAKSSAGSHPSDPQEMAKARHLVDQGLEAYRLGEYDKAESELKEAIMIHPFWADATLTLGKVLLIRGSANRDRSLVDSARLMFEMTRALDPNQREVEVLLELFRAAPE